MSSEGEKLKVAKRRGSGAESIRPEALKQIASDADVAAWNTAFDITDCNHDGTIELSELDLLGLPSQVSELLAGLVDPKRKRSFVREAFLLAMAEAHGFRLAST